jgi:hypothetical protein
MDTSIPTPEHGGSVRKCSLPARSFSLIKIIGFISEAGHFFTHDHASFDGPFFNLQGMM